MQADPFVSIDVENPLAGCVGQGHITGPGEIVAPRFTQEQRAVFQRDIGRTIRGSSIDDDDLVDNRSDARQTRPEVGFLVTDDQRSRNPHQW